VLQSITKISANGSLTYNPILQTIFLIQAHLWRTGTIPSFGQKWLLAGLSLTQTLFDQSVFTGLKAANQPESFTKSTSN
jgi:hypothetical protein